MDAWVIFWIELPGLCTSSLLFFLFESLCFYFLVFIFELVVRTVTNSMEANLQVFSILYVSYVYLF